MRLSAAAREPASGSSSTSLWHPTTPNSSVPQIGGTSDDDAKGAFGHQVGRVTWRLSSPSSSTNLCNWKAARPVSGITVAAAQSVSRNRLRSMLHFLARSENGRSLSYRQANLSSYKAASVHRARVALYPDLGTRASERDTLHICLFERTNRSVP